jgi:acyl carrier protein
MTTEERVKSIIAKQLQIEKQDKIIESAHFIDDLGADSLDMVELVMAMEEEFKLKIEEEDSQKLVTVGNVIQYVTHRLSTQTH